MTNIASIVGPAYLVAAFLFILGLKRLSSPATARSGNRLAGIAMAIALGVTLLDPDIFPALVHLEWIPILSIVIGTAIGGGLGVYFARTVKMTAMPQMVAIFNGMGGGTAALVSVAEITRAVAETGSGGSAFQVIAAVLGTAIGAVSFSGSVIAFMKLQELMSDRPLRFGGQVYVNGLLLLGILALGGVVLVTGRRFVSIGIIVVGTLIGAGLGGWWARAVKMTAMPQMVAIFNGFGGLASLFVAMVLDARL